MSISRHKLEFNKIKHVYSPGSDAWLHNHPFNIPHATTVAVHHQIFHPEGEK
jgi:hypothetical protein